MYVTAFFSLSSCTFSSARLSPLFFPASVIKASVWVCDCACVNRRAIFAFISACVLFIIPSEEREREGGRENKTSRKLLRTDQYVQTYTHHHWTRATDATPLMFVNATDKHILVIVQQLTTGLISYKSWH